MKALIPIFLLLAGALWLRRRARESERRRDGRRPANNEWFI